MATNVVPLNVYQINQGPPIPLADVVAIAFPTQGCVIQSCIGSPDRALSTGVNVYASIQLPTTWSGAGRSSLYYVRETIAQLVTLFNA